eukprot:5809967-Prymnesium_polylepis.2
MAIDGILGKEQVQYTHYRTALPHPVRCAGACPGRKQRLHRVSVSIGHVCGNDVVPAIRPRHDGRRGVSRVQMFAHLVRPALQYAPRHRRDRCRHGHDLKGSTQKKATGCASCGTRGQHDCSSNPHQRSLAIIAANINQRRRLARRAHRDWEV